MKIKKLIILISLVLELRFKSLCIISSFVGREQGIALVEEYDKNPMLVNAMNICILW
jgi:hypothetical protein